MALVCAAAWALSACEAGSDARDSSHGTAEVDLYSVSVVDARHAVAVGAHGTLLRSEDAGENWSHPSASDDVRGFSPWFSVSMADAQVGWAVGPDGRIARTDDGGRHWRRQAAPESGLSPHLLAVHALDRRRAVTVGTWGTVWVTGDGEHWRDVSLQIDAAHPQFAWLDPAQQAAIRSGARVPDDVALQQVRCLAGGARCWIVGEFGTLLVSDDAARSWAPAAIEADAPEAWLPQSDDRAESGPEGAALQGLVAALRERPAARLRLEAAASDAEIGAARDPAALEALFERLVDRVELARARLVALGAGSERLRSAGEPPWDLAATPRDPALRDFLALRRSPQAGVRVTLESKPMLFGVAFDTSARGWAAGLGGSLLESRDGGRRWRRLAAPGRETCFGLAAAQGRVLCAGEEGLSAFSMPEEGPGRQVGRFPLGVDYPLRDVDFSPDGSLGLAVGEAGRIARSRDAGLSWQRLPPVPGSSAGRSGRS